MRNRNWLNFAEYLMLVGAGAGAIAAAIYQQILYTAAPVSILLLLNLVNRTRGEEENLDYTTTAVARVENRVVDDIDSLKKQVQALPSFLDLTSLRRTLQNNNQEAIAGLEQELEQLREAVSDPRWASSVDQALHELNKHYHSLSNTVDGVTHQLHELSVADRLENADGAIAQLRTDLEDLHGQLDQLNTEAKFQSIRFLQDQINHINRRLNQLPTPFDPTSLRQDMDSVMRVIGDMASRRDLSRVVTQVEQLSQHHQHVEQSVTPLRVSTNILKKQMETLSQRLNHLAESPAGDATAITQLRATVQQLEQQIAALQTQPDAASLRAEVQQLVDNHLGQLREQLQAVQLMAQDLDRQHKSLQDWVGRLPQLLDSAALHNQMRQLAERVDSGATNETHLQAQVDAAVKQQLDTVMAELRNAATPSGQPSPPHYELVFDVKTLQRRADPAISGCNSRTILEQALDTAAGRLVIVYPYPTPETLDAGLIQRFRHFLERQGCLDLGWGHLGKISNHAVSRGIDQRRSLAATEKGFLYDVLQQLTQLKREYPDQFRFKVLGTDENFLVCDRRYAILGTQSIATASAVFPQAAVGLRTNDPDVIQQLVERFDDPLLAADDAVAHCRRAITRYDLGDREGALADYSTVLTIQPNHDVACNNRGLVRYDLGDREGAIADFSLAIQHNADNFVAYCNRGYVRAELGDRLGAIEDFTFALRLHADYAPAYLYRGLSRSRMRNKLGAVQDYSEVLRLNPQDAIACFYRALACIKLGQYADAAADLQRAIDLFSRRGDRGNAQQALKVLQKLGELRPDYITNQPLIAYPPAQ